MMSTEEQNNCKNTDNIKISIEPTPNATCDNANKIAEEGSNSNNIVRSQMTGKNSDTPTDLLCVPRNGHRMSFMEEESVRERMRLSLLKQCSAILKQGDQKYNKESLHRTFQDEVRYYFEINSKITMNFVYSFNCRYL